MYSNVVICGFGGQGIIFAGKLLSHAGLREGKEISYYPSYGAEMRGGAANCTVIISSSMIPSPIVSRPSTAIIMSYPALEKFLPRIQEKGLIVINKSLISEKISRHDLRVLEIPANQIAEELGSSRAANMVALGGWNYFSRAVNLESLILSLQEVLSRNKMDLLKINEDSLKKGWEFASNSH